MMEWRQAKVMAVRVEVGVKKKFGSHSDSRDTQNFYTYHRFNQSILSTESIHVLLKGIVSIICIRSDDPF